MGAAPHRISGLRTVLALFSGEPPTPLEFRSPTLHVRVQPGGTRARRIVSRRNARVTGKYASVKMGKLMHWESALERDAFMLLDVDTRVMRFREQPAQMIYDDGNTAFTHFPDLLIESRQSIYFAEVKSDRDAQTPEVQQRCRLLTQHLAGFGLGYHLLTEKQLAAQPHLDNARVVRRYGYVQVDTRTRAHLLKRAEEEELTWGELAVDEHVLAAACHLIIAGQLTLPWHKAIVDHTPITKSMTE